jgi:hypothetical protein
MSRLAKGLADAVEPTIAWQEFRRKYLHDSNSRSFLLALDSDKLLENSGLLSKRSFLIFQLL